MFGIDITGHDGILLVVLDDAGDDAGVGEGDAVVVVVVVVEDLGGGWGGAEVVEI